MPPQRAEFVPIFKADDVIGMNGFRYRQSGLLLMSGKSRPCPPARARETAQRLVDLFQQLRQVGSWQRIMSDISRCHFGCEMNEVIGISSIRVHGKLTEMIIMPKLGSTAQN